MARLKRPRDTNQLAKFIVDVATGERNETLASLASEPVNELARAGGLKGGKARALKLTQEQRIQIAKKGAAARWGVMDTIRADEVITVTLEHDSN